MKPKSVIPVEMAEFKKKVLRQKQVRKRCHSSDESDEDEEGAGISNILDETKELQKMRKRNNGINIEVLAAACEKRPVVTSLKNDDPFKTSTGGFVDMKALKKKGISGEAQEQIGTAFAAETNRRDEDADMLKYVEQQLKRQKGSQNDDSPEKKSKVKGIDDVIHDVPEFLRTSTNKRTEDMLSNQMLSGIPEIDLGIEAKIRNIEQTEEAKQRLLRELKQKKKEDVSDFVPTNMAVNFVQHNRFNIEDSSPILKKEESKPRLRKFRVGEVGPVEITEEKLQTEKSTDDFHYQKFKNNAIRR